MAKLLSQHVSVAIRLALCIVIGCLAMHFLLEDTRLITVPASQNADQTENMSYDEVTHQDDLVILACTLTGAISKAVPAATVWSIPAQKQNSFPILTPPKIA